MSNSSTVALATNVITTGTVASKSVKAEKATFQCFGSTSAGAGSATVNVEVSNDNVAWVVMGTFNLTLSTTSGDEAEGFIAPNMLWEYARANVTAITGTDASVSLTMGV